VQDIAELEEAIRNLYNEHHVWTNKRPRDPSRHSRVAAALDTLRSTTFALTYFQHQGLPRSRVTSPVRLGARYLHLYGVLQSAYMQQDAILDLGKLLLGAAPRTSDLSGWRDLRQWRDDLSHPQRGAPLIAEFSMSRQGFQVWRHPSPKKQPTMEYVSLPKLLHAYRSDAAAVLGRLHRQLRAKWGAA